MNRPPLSRLKVPAAVLSGGGIMAALAGCGAGTVSHHRPAQVRLDGRVTGDDIRETSPAGVGFLVPTSILSRQGTASFDVVSPSAGNPRNESIVIGPAVSASDSSQAEQIARTWTIGPIVTGTTPQRAQTELLVTGEPGRRVYLGFEESCGFVPVAPGATGQTTVAGAHGQRLVRTPAVMKLPRLRSTPSNRCYVSGTVVSRDHRHLQIRMLDYSGNGTAARG